MRHSNTASGQLHGYVPPSLDVDAFNCPHCSVFSRQALGKAHWIEQRHDGTVSRGEIADVRACDHCHKLSVWIGGCMVYPKAVTAPPPHEDLSEDVKRDYDEAARIVADSPRGACALLRLCIQKICKELGEKGDRINDDIKSLVSKGLPVEIQRALDIVRVVGNNAVHPGQIDLNDVDSTAMKLFDLVNLVADVTIGQPKRIGIMYGSLPENSRKAIESRDSTI